MKDVPMFRSASDARAVFAGLRTHLPQITNPIESEAVMASPDIFADMTGEVSSKRAQEFIGEVVKQARKRAKRGAK